MSFQKLKNPMPMPAQPDPANSPSGSTIADKLSGGIGISQEPAVNVTVGNAVTGGQGPMPEPPMKGFEQKPGRSGKVR